MGRERAGVASGQSSRKQGSLQRSWFKQELRREVAGEEDSGDSFRESAVRLPCLTLDRCVYSHRGKAGEVSGAKRGAGGEGDVPVEQADPGNVSLQQPSMGLLAWG